MKYWNKTTKTVLKWGIGILILVLLFMAVDLNTFVHSLRNVSWPLIILSVVLGIGTLTLAMVNIHLLLLAIKKRVQLKKLFHYVTASWALGSILPGRVGEFSLIYLLKKREDVPYVQGFTVAVMDKIITVIVLIGLGAYGFFLFDIEHILIYLVLAVVGIGVLTFVILGEHKMGKYIERFLLKSKNVSLQELLKTSRILLIKRADLLFLNLGVTLIKWVYSTWLAYLIFLAFGIHLPFVIVLVGFAFITLTSLIPISIGGLGVQEAAGMFFFVKMGVLPALALNALIMITIKKYLLCLFFYAINHDLFEKKS